MRELIEEIDKERIKILLMKKDKIIKIKYSSLLEKIIKLLKNYEEGYYDEER